jgi:hypothetical protein
MSQVGMNAKLFCWSWEEVGSEWATSSKKPLASIPIRQAADETFAVRLRGSRFVSDYIKTRRLIAQQSSTAMLIEEVDQIACF